MPPKKKNPRAGTQTMRSTVALWSTVGVYEYWETCPPDATESRSLYLEICQRHCA